MIKKYVSACAVGMGVKLSKVLLVDGKSVGCLDVYLLKISSKGHYAEVLVFQAELDIMKQGICCDPLEARIRTALSDLLIMLKPITATVSSESEY